MRFAVERNWIEVVGKGWYGQTMASRIDLDAYALHNIGEPTRENVEHWLALNSGDFQSVTDFRAVVGEEDMPWSDEENELAYNDCMYPMDQDA